MCVPFFPMGLLEVNLDKKQNIKQNIKPEYKYNIIYKEDTTFNGRK